MANATCKEAGCAERAYVAGQCRTHRPACIIDGCDMPQNSRTWCSKHYARWQRHGSTDAPPARTHEYRGECSVVDCGYEVRGKGLCQAHYMRLWRYGDTSPGTPLPGVPSDDIQVRFWSKVGRGQDWECWEWAGAAAPSGHGRFRAADGRSACAYRVAYEWCVGPIPPGLEIDHLCFNPSCVNPYHLEPVTPEENKRRIPLKSHCPQGHPYSDTNTYFKANGNRVCKSCDNARSRASHARRLAESSAA